MPNHQNSRRLAKIALREILSAGLDPTPENFARYYKAGYQSDLLNTACTSMAGLFLENPDIQSAIDLAKTLNSEGKHSELLAHFKFIEEHKAVWLGTIVSLRQAFRNGMACLGENQDQCTRMVQEQCSAASRLNTESLSELQAYHRASVATLSKIGELFDGLSEKILALEGLLEAVEQGIPGGESTADRDPLTNLLNRRGFMRRLKRAPPAGTLLSLDLDHFKTLNDRYGHPAGDTILKGVSEILRSECRAKDVVGRFGGEEFLIFLPGVSVQDGSALAERLRWKLSIRPLQVNPVEQTWVTTSIGVVGWDCARFSFEEAYALADKALYEAKHQGRNCVVTHNAKP